MLSVRTVADEKAVPWSGKLLPSTQFVPSTKVSGACPALFQVDGVLRRELQRPDVTPGTTAEEAPTPSGDQPAHPLRKDHPTSRIPRFGES